MTRRPTGVTSSNARVRLAVLGLALAIVLACGPSAAGESAPTPQRTDSPTTTPNLVPSGTPRPTDSPSSSASASLPPGEAEIDVSVIDKSSLAPIANAIVRLDAYQREARTDATGAAQLSHLAVSGTCRWVTIVVTAAGYGSVEVVDVPLYPLRGTLDFRLTQAPQRSYIGPPSGNAEGDKMCTR